MNFERCGNSYSVFYIIFSLNEKLHYTENLARLYLSNRNKDGRSTKFVFATFVRVFADV
jgi:hypothetical protein